VLVTSQGGVCADVLAVEPNDGLLVLEDPEPLVLDDVPFDCDVSA
jgi:hypothetical protein